ncbi:hypothetical protein [Ideonella paludis]|uniref:Uncharacterized protein n=1 Tax=Ideonella paludis TaxID=1233411 RepID=A0ABS5DZ80_9BURK|nr:hypothetical protein [Ideonella paludis]MBQ0936460.1 hypothetical protein [Ideonella paludis]
MDRFAALLESAMAGGATFDAALALLRTHGATPVQAIKAIHQSRMVTLGEAKQLFARSPAWAHEVQAADALHEELLALLGKEQDR